MERISVLLFGLSIRLGRDDFYLVLPEKSYTDIIK